MEPPEALSMKSEDAKITDDPPLDDLLSLRGKPFADWKEERMYLRKKWGEQGRKVAPGAVKPEASETDLSKEEKQG